MSEKTWYLLFRGTQFPISAEEATDLRVLTAGAPQSMMYFEFTPLGQTEMIRIEPIREAALVQL